METLNNRSGFVVGTLVHTDQGLVPIEQLKIGNKVLSKATDGRGELVYKAVTKTIQTENVPVYFANFIPSFVDNLRFRERMNLSLYVDVLCTANHPFWVEGKGWINADQLQINDNVLLKDGSTAYFSGGNSQDRKIDVVFKTDQPNVGYIPNFHNDTNNGCFIDLETGRTLSFGGYDPVFRKLFIEDTGWRERLLAQTPTEHKDTTEFYGFRHGFWQDGAGIVWDEGEGPVTTTVYNIEVEDTHTYFVGEAGIWVNNKA